MKQIHYIHLAIAVLFLLFNVIAFAIPISHNETFWILYSFTVIAILMQIFVWHIAFNKAETLKAKFFNIPAINISSVYLILQFIAFVRCITIPELPAWTALIACSALFGIALICLIGLSISKNTIINVENKVKEKVFFIKSLQADIEILIPNESNDEVKNALHELLENLKYSDPISHESLLSLEQNISNKINMIQITEDKLSIIKEINELIKQRNTKCKLLK